MAVSSVKCAFTSASSSNLVTDNFLMSNSGVMTNVCSPGLAHSAQTQSPNHRQQFSSPSLDITASDDLNRSSPISTNSNHNSRAMQQLIETNNSSTPIDLITENQTISPEHSPNHSLDDKEMNHLSNEMDVERPKSTISDDHIKDDISDHELVNRNSPSSRSNTAQSPNHILHLSNSTHSPQFTKNNSDRKENKKPVFLPQRCNENELFYPGDHKDDWVCDCKPGHIYYPLTDRCYSAYRQGPCKPNEFLMISFGKYIPECLPNRCNSDGLVTFKNACHSLDKAGPCELPELTYVVGVNATTLELECIKQNPNIVQKPDIFTRIGEEDEVGDTCYKGTKRAIAGKC